MDDFALLKRYITEGDESAFSQIVESYLGMVFGTALRRTRNRQLAEEISQNVFAILAAKASTLKQGTVISGWLHRTAVHQAIHAMRTEQRRSQRMKEFSEALSHEESSFDDPQLWNEVVQLMDSSMNQLNQADRNVLFLRFCEDKKFSEMGKMLGKSESAMQRHTKRALEKLNHLLRRKGVALPMVTLVLGLSSELGKAASPPVGLTATVSKMALSGTLTNVTSPSYLTSLTLTMTTMKTSTLILSGCLLVALFTSGGVLISGLNKEEASSGNILNTEGGASNLTTSSQSNDLSKSFEPENRRSQVTRLLNEAFKIAQETESPETKSAKIQTLIESLDLEEFPESVAYVLNSSESKGVRQLVAKNIFRRWGFLDPITAMESALESESPDELIDYTSAVANSWSQIDPQSALAWYEKMRDSKDHSFGSGGLGTIIDEITEGMISHDVDLGFSMLEKLSLDEQTSVQKSMKRLAKDSEMSHAVADRIAKISDEDLKSKVAADFGTSWVVLEAAKTTEWFDQIEFENSSLEHKAAIGIAWTYFSESPDKAVDWFYPKVPEGNRVKFVQIVVGKRWVERNREEAVKWLIENNYDPEEIIK